jgi:hypothetical protein
VAGGPGFVIAVRGQDIKRDAGVLFDQSPLATRFISATELQADIPASLIEKAGVHAIAVQTPDGKLSNELLFRVFPDPPAVFSIDPDIVAEGSNGLKVTITGDKFQPGAAARIVENGSPVRLDTVFITSRSLEARLPASVIEKAGNVPIAVENPDFGISNTATLRVLIRNPLVVNEYLADPPDGPAGDANGDGTRSSSQDEFVEIINRTPEGVDISGFRLSDAEAVRHVFPPGTVVPPFESAVVFGGGRPQGEFGNAAANGLVFVASSGGLSLNNGGDTIRLEDAGGKVIQQIAFGAIEGGAGEGINRDPDVDGAAFSLHTRVAEDVARLFSPGAKASGAPLRQARRRSRSRSRAETFCRAR